MRRSLWIALLLTGLALASLPFAWREAESQKERILITEEVLSGSPEAASGVTLEVASHWRSYLLWDTKYTIGSGKEAESEFDFTAQGMSLEWVSRRTANVEFMYGEGFGSCKVEEYGYDLNPENMPYPEAVGSAAGQTHAGEVHVEMVRLGDYYEYYPVFFMIMGSSVTYEGDYVEETEYMTELFHISTAEDFLELTIERDAAGALVSLSGQRVAHPSDAIVLAESAAFGEAGGYYAFCCEDVETGERADREANAGIFYFPFREEDGEIFINRLEMRKVCPLPESAVPVGMLLDEERGRLYLAVRQGADFQLLVYGLDGEIPVLAQSVTLRRGTEAFRRADAESGIPEWDSEEPGSAQAPYPQLEAMTMEEGGLLMSWNDNGFSFVVEDNGQYRLWCSGQFPLHPEMEGDEDWTRTEAVHGYPFASHRECLYDGERLVLAAFGATDNLDVLLAVYGEEGEEYCGLYRHSGGLGSGMIYYGNYYANRILPQGNSGWNWMYLEGRDSQAYVRGTGEPVEPLKLSDGS